MFAAFDIGQFPEGNGVALNEFIVHSSLFIVYELRTRNYELLSREFFVRKPFVAGNWKMNTDSQSSVGLADGIACGSMDIAGRSVDVAVIPPFVYLQVVVKVLNGVHIAVGAQDIYYEQKGAFTGEISALMLKSVGCVYVLCGHSERRHVIGESDELVDKKVTATICGGLLPYSVWARSCRSGKLRRRARW